MSEERYLVWSYEHGGWWGPARSGYTRELGAAGWYTVEEAREICIEANRYTVRQMEVMVLEAEAVKFEQASRCDGAGLEFNLVNWKDLEFICEIAEGYYEREYGLEKEVEWLARIRKYRDILRKEIKRLEVER